MQAETDTVFSELQQDSVELVVATPVISLFEGHSLVDQNDFIAIDRTSNASNFGFLIMLICFFLIIYIQRNSDGVFGSVFKAGFDRNLANQDARIENSQRTRNLMLLQLVAILSLALFISSVYIRFYETDLNAPTAYLWAFGIILNAIMLKRIVQWLLVSIFDLQAGLKLYRFSGNILLALSGLVLLPLSALLMYSPQIPIMVIVVLGSAIAVFFYLKSLLRGIQISLMSKSVSPLHLFYYFCALELLPVFVFVRIAKSL